MLDLLDNIEMSGEHRARVREQIEQAERFAAFFIGTARLLRWVVTPVGVGMSSVMRSARAMIAKWARRHHRARVLSSNTRNS